MLYNFNFRDKQLQAAEKYLAVCKIGWSKSHVGELSFCNSRWNRLFIFPMFVFFQILMVHMKCVIKCQ